MTGKSRNQKLSIGPHQMLAMGSGPEWRRSPSPSRTGQTGTGPRADSPSVALTSLRCGQQGRWRAAMGYRARFCQVPLELSTSSASSSRWPSRTASTARVQDPTTLADRFSHHRTDPISQEGSSDECPDPFDIRKLPCLIASCPDNLEHPARRVALRRHLQSRGMHGQPRFSGAVGDRSRRPGTGLRARWNDGGA